MPAARKPKPLVVNEAKSFDVDAFIAGFKRPEFTRNLYQRADLQPRLIELDDLINELQDKLDQAEAAEGEKPERGIDDVNVVATYRERITRLVEELNELYSTYEASAVAFTFRIPDQAGDDDAVKRLMTAAGEWVEPKDREDWDEDQTEAFSMRTVLYSMSNTCTSHPLTVDQWQKLRETVGEPAFNSLAQAWVEAVKAARPTAPFSLKSLPGRVSTASSNA